MLRKLWPLLPVLLLAFAGMAWAQDIRHFTFHYAFTVKDVSSGEKVRIWIPQSHSDAFQTVKVISATGDLPLKKTRESRRGNEMYYAETSKAKQQELHFEVVYDVVRHERLTFGIYAPHLETVKLSDRERKEYLAPDALVPTTGLPAELAVKVTEGKTTPLEKARAIYDYVFTTMRYDKTGTGWGRGDVLYACDAKKGNCTDFHSLFIAMARSQGIPARFEIGFSLPEGQKEGTVPGYHSWAEFYVNGIGWVPVDAGGGSQDPSKRDDFFGALDAHRVTFSTGRDIMLTPAAQGGPLDYVAYPYVEADGRPSSVSSMDFFFNVSEFSAPRTIFRKLIFARGPSLTPDLSS